MAVGGRPGPCWRSPATSLLTGGLQRSTTFSRIVARGRRPARAAASRNRHHRHGLPEAEERPGLCRWRGSVDARSSRRPATSLIGDQGHTTRACSWFRRSDARSGQPDQPGNAHAGTRRERLERGTSGARRSAGAIGCGGWVNWPAYDAADPGGSARGSPAAAAALRNGPGALAGTIEMISRSDLGTSRASDAGSRDSLEAPQQRRGKAPAAACSASPDAAKQQRIHSRSAKARAARRMSQRHIAGRAGAGAGSRRSAARSKPRIGRRWLARDWRTRGTDFSANRTDGPSACPVRLVGRGAALAMERAGILAVAELDEQLRERQSQDRSQGGASLTPRNACRRRARRKRGGPPPCEWD